MYLQLIINVHKNYFLYIILIGLLVLALISTKYDLFYLLLAYMLFMPLLDGCRLNRDVIWLLFKKRGVLWLLCGSIAAFLAGQNIQLWQYFLITLAIAALPEEWFFRGYIQDRLGNGVLAILISSLLFSLVHVISISWMVGMLVFIPSLIYGYIYRKTGDIVLVILLHSLSNLIYKLYIYEWLVKMSII